MYYTNNSHWTYHHSSIIGVNYQLTHLRHLILLLHTASIDPSLHVLGASPKQVNHGVGKIPTTTPSSCLSPDDFTSWGVMGGNTLWANCVILCHVKKNGAGYPSWQLVRIAISDVNHRAAAFAASRSRDKVSDISAVSFHQSSSTL